MSIEVHVRYKDIERVFEGNVDTIWICVNRFFSETIPHFNVAQGIMVTTNLKEIIKSNQRFSGHS